MNHQPVKMLISFFFFLSWEMHLAWYHVNINWMFVILFFIGISQEPVFLIIWAGTKKKGHAYCLHLLNKDTLIYTTFQSKTYLRYSMYHIPSYVATLLLHQRTCHEDYSGVKTVHFSWSNLQSLVRNERTAFVNICLKSMNHFFQNY